MGGFRLTGHTGQDLPKLDLPHEPGNLNLRPAQRFPGSVALLLCEQLGGLPGRLLREGGGADEV